MFRLQERTAAEGIAKHQSIGQARVYENDGVQNDRIRVSRETVAKALALLDLLKPAPHTVLEIGCGTCDISGPLAAENKVFGMECNQLAIACALQRFPAIMRIYEGDLEDHPARDMDVVIMCEMLEHVVDPAALVKKWLPQARYSVISHPIDEPSDSQASGGEHCWSFNRGDFGNWFAIGGHRMLEEQTVRVGCYDVAVALGERA